MDTEAAHSWRQYRQVTKVKSFLTCRKAAIEFCQFMITCANQFSSSVEEEAKTFKIDTDRLHNTSEQRSQID